MTAKPKDSQRRIEFEAWVRTRDKTSTFERDSEGQYVYIMPRIWWEAWEARGAGQECAVRQPLPIDAIRMVELMCCNEDASLDAVAFARGLEAEHGI